MPHGSAIHETTFGYLSTLESAEHGYFGGYLIISHLGRPLEFHCTAPVRPSRAQRILYGPTLEPYLLGEQLAGALLDVARLTPGLILTNSDSTLHARSRSAVPLVLLNQIELPAAEDTIPTEHSYERQDASTVLRAASVEANFVPGTFTLGSCRFQLPLGYESEEGLVIELLTGLGRHVELAEPFGRIEEAIREAQRLGGRGADTYEQAA